MKKAIIYLIGLLLVLSLVSAQPPVPAPVKFYVYVNGYGVNFDATVTNTRTGEVLTVEDTGTLRVRNGIGYFDLSDFKQGYQAANPFFGYVGDKIEIKACDIHKDCTYSFYLKSRDPIENTYRIELYDSKITDVSYIVRWVCWDNSIVESEVDCPPKPQPEKVTEIIEKEIEKEVIKEVPIYDPTTVTAISVVILALLMIWSWAKNTDLKGKYRWIPGMASILNKLLEEYKQEKDKERSTKLKKTILKYSVTITEKYLNNLKK